MITQMPEPKFFIIAGVVLFIAIICHEFGHWLYIYRRKGYKMRPRWFRDPDKWFSWGIEMDYPHELTRPERINYMLFGIVFGFVPLFFALGFAHRGYILLIPLYVIGSHYDYKQLLEDIKEESKELEEELKGG
jgi:hypothetical protein